MEFKRVYSLQISEWNLQVVRARLQDTECRYAGSWDCVQRIVRFEGVRGLYKGLTPYLVHVMPNICLVFVIYEKIANG